MSATRPGCTWATIATYVANEETHVTSALSPPISLSPGGLGGARPEGRADNLSARAILSGSSSRMSTNSSAWMRRTSFAGTGAMLFATLNGKVFGLLHNGGRAGASCMLVAEPDEGTANAIGADRPAAPATTEDGMRGMFARESGRED